MKFFANLLVVCGAGAFGYFAEPSLRLELTGISPTAPPAVPQPGNQQEAILAKVNLLGYAAAQLPKELTLKKDVEVTDTSSGLKVTIPAGKKVKMLRLETGMVIVGTGNIEAAVEVQDTDIREQIIANPPAAVDPNAIAAASPQPPAMDAMAKNGTDDTAPAPAEGEKPAETAGTDPTMKEPTEGGNPALAPEKTPAEPAGAAGEFAAMTPDDIVKSMQDSLKATGLTNLKFDQVTEWVGAEPEEMDGKKFNTGIVNYKAQTILGLKAQKAKAYIQGGKVVRWVNAKSGTEIQ